jgi:asparagine synthase (glutamine-hydrolysing)
MSGIAGIIHFDGKPIETGLIAKMTGAMAYRGPDGINHWVKGSVALGHCMLRTTPESIEEHQPLTNEDESLVLVMDGRVDNWEELRKDFRTRGVTLRSHADAELVLRAYELWGRDSLDHIDGDFAILIWDAHRQEAFAARDRMGSKPLNYQWYGKTLVFSSELHAILINDQVEQSVNEGMLAEFLAAEWYSRNETLWEGIMRLMPAHLMICGAAGPRTESYWEPDIWRTLPYTKDAEYIEHYRDLLIDSVRRLSRSHMPVAIEVSGGLDSSAIFCIAEHLRRAGRLIDSVADGYTLPFRDDQKANETSYVQAIVDYLDKPIREVPPSRVPLSWFSQRAHAYLDFPGFPNATMAESLLAEASSRGSRVILNGVGGDEWLAGSRLYYAEALGELRWAELFASCKRDIKEYGLTQTLRWVARYGLIPLLPHRGEALLRHLVRRCRGNRQGDVYWLAPSMREAIQRRRVTSHQMQYQDVRCIGQRQLLATLHDAYLGIAREQAERSYASFGMEPRRPLHTAELVQFAFSTPENLRLRGGRDKFIHAQALSRLMPRAIIERRTKAEFSGMFHGYLGEMRDFFFYSLPADRPNWVTPDGLRRLFNIYRSNSGSGWPQWILWSILGCDIFAAQATERRALSSTHKTEPIARTAAVMNSLSPNRERST